MTDVRIQYNTESTLYVCEICNKPMLEEDHDFSDICSACLEKLN